LKSKNKFVLIFISSFINLLLLWNKWNPITRILLNNWEKKIIKIYCCEDGYEKFNLSQQIYLYCAEYFRSWEYIFEMQAARLRLLQNRRIRCSIVSLGIYYVLRYIFLRHITTFLAREDTYTLRELCSVRMLLSAVVSNNIKRYTARRIWRSSAVASLARHVTKYIHASFCVVFIFLRLGVLWHFDSFSYFDLTLNVIIRFWVVFIEEFQEE